MMTMKMLEHKLQKADRKQAALYLFCNFVSLLLITAYCAMMFSPTVLTIFPDGGDSRKQMTAIFVLALFGCVIFTIYASGLFFRKKARQLGSLMALGASRKRLSPGLFREVLLLGGVSSLLGIFAGIPFVFILWNGFRLFIVDSEEMQLKLDFKCLYLSAAFLVIVMAFSCLNAYRYLKRTDIMDVVHEEHKNEPVRELGAWCGPAGIFLVLAGAVMGYYASYVYEIIFHAYSSALINIFYAPVFPGLYMIMLHTVAHGWRSRKKQPCKNIIARSMMKFQGKQTVNNLLVCTMLTAGGCFGLFYMPMLSMGNRMSINSRPFDYYYHYRMDQSVPGQEEIKELAAKHGLAIKDFRKAPYIQLGMDGTAEVEDEDHHFHYEHIGLLTEGKFFSETSYRALTGQDVSVEKGTYMAITNTEETGLYFLNLGASLLTNMVTRKTLAVSLAGYAHQDLLYDMAGQYILNDGDYALIADGLSPDWMGSAAFFNIDGEDSYAFAHDFFYTLVSSFGPECEYPSFYDRVAKIRTEEAGEVYWGDTDLMTGISYNNPDSSDFRLYWYYMPKIRMLDKEDFSRTFSVFLMMFLFISIICSLAAMIISYTRCMTIALNNRYVFDDLKRLGASPAFLRKEIRHQAGPVFQIPCIVGMSGMYVLYVLIMTANDGRLTGSEVIGLAGCLMLLLLIAAIYYLVYRYTVKRMCEQLEVSV